MRIFAGALTFENVTLVAAEDEHVLLPLSNFEIMGMRREIFHTAEGEDAKMYSLNVLEIKLNLNLNALTLEQLELSRKTTAIEFACGLLQESEGLLSGSTIVSKDKLAAKLMKVRDRQAKDFNDIHSFRKIINDVFSEWEGIMQDYGEKLQAHALSLDGTKGSGSIADRETTLHQAKRIFEKLNRTDKLEELATQLLSTASSNTSDAQFAKMLVGQGDVFGTARDSLAPDTGKGYDAAKVQKALDSYEMALQLLREDPSRESKRIVPVVHKKKGNLLLQKSEDAATLAAALDSLAAGLVLAEEQCKGNADAQMSLLCADILEPVGILLVQRPEDVVPGALIKFQGGGREASASSMFQSALALRVDAVGVEDAVAKSATLLELLADLAAKEGATSTASAPADPKMLLACQVFDVLTTSGQTRGSSSNPVLKVVNGMQANMQTAADDGSSRVHEWGARAISALFKHGAPAASAAEAVRVLTRAAKEHRRNAALSLEVCILNVYMCIYTHLCTCTRVYTHIHTCIHARVYIHTVCVVLCR